MDPALMAEVEGCLVDLGGKSDMLGGGQQSDVAESRALVNLLLNNLPEDKFVCPVKGCGRRFGEQAKLQEHVKRRHKV